MSKTLCTSLYNKYIVYFYLNIFVWCLFGFDSGVTWWKLIARFHKTKQKWFCGWVRTKERSEKSEELLSAVQPQAFWCGLFSVHSDGWFPVSHRLSDTKTSDRARSVNITVQSHPLTVIQTMLKGRGRWHSMCSTRYERVLCETSDRPLLCKLK